MCWVFCVIRSDGLLTSTDFILISLTMSYSIGRNIALLKWEINEADFLWNWNYFSSLIQIYLYKMLGFGYGHVISKRFICRINYKFDNEEKMRDKYGCKIFTFDPRYWMSTDRLQYLFIYEYKQSKLRLYIQWFFWYTSNPRVVKTPLIGLKNSLEILKIVSNSIEFLWLHDQNTLLKWLFEKPTV